jgi:prolyl-tRNA synthetase
MLHGDDNGLVLPPRVAPIQVVIIPIYYSDKDKENVVQKAMEIHDILEKNNVRVKLDDRDQVTPGFKFNDWELKGIPLRIEIGPKDIEKKKVVLARRHNREKHDQAISGIEKMVLSELVSIHNDMFSDAKKILDGKTVTVSTYVDFKSELEKGRLIHAPICGNQQCEEKIKEETGADIRVVPENSDDKTSKCIYCEKQSETIPLFARGY